LKHGAAWIGTVPGLQDANDRPKVGLVGPYNGAQELISRWQLELKTLVERAVNTQEPWGFNTAIAEAELIPNTNPRASSGAGKSWRRQVETIEDQPYLDRAEELADFRGCQFLQERQ